MSTTEWIHSDDLLKRVNSGTVGQYRVMNSKELSAMIRCLRSEGIMVEKRKQMVRDGSAVNTQIMYRVIK